MFDAATGSNTGRRFTGLRRHAINDCRDQRGDPAKPPPDAQLVAEALRQLAPDHRVVVVRACLGHSVTQLAEDLHIPQATVLNRIFLGLHALRGALHDRGLLGP